MNISNPKIKIGIIILLLGIWLSGCVGEQQIIKKGSIKKKSSKEPTRDRTPNTPRINIPRHNF
jgi:hypothetical protein